MSVTRAIRARPQRVTLSLTVKCSRLGFQVAIQMVESRLFTETLLIPHLIEFYTNRDYASYGNLTPPSAKDQP